MKIAIINSVADGFSSTGRLITDIAEYIKSCKDECLVFYSQGKSECKYAKRFGFYLENKIHAVLSRLTGLQGYYSYFGTIQLISYLKDLSPDIVHLNNMHSNDINLFVLLDYLKMNNIATVVTLHDCYLYTARCFHYTNNECYQWISGCKKCQRDARTSPTWFFRRTSKMFKDKEDAFKNIRLLKIVGVSKWITFEAEKSYLANIAQFETIYNWIDTSLFFPKESNCIRAKYNIGTRFVILGVCGYWNNTKGLSSFLSLTKLLSKEYIIVLVGNMDDTIKLKYDGNGIIFISAVKDKEELAVIYSMADVYMNFSTEESFGLTNSEALACGTPIIVCNTTASPEFVGEKCGYIVNKGDEEDVINKLRIMYLNTKHYYSESCRNYACELFDKSNNLYKYRKMYKDFLDNN